MAVEDDAQPVTGAAAPNTVANALPAHFLEWLMLTGHVPPGSSIEALKKQNVLADVVRSLCPSAWSQRQQQPEEPPELGLCSAGGCSSLPPEAATAAHCLSEVLLGSFNGAILDVESLVNAMVAGGLACTSVWRFVLLYALCCPDRMRHLRGLVLLPGDLQDALANAAIIGEAQLGGSLRSSEKALAGSRSREGSLARERTPTASERSALPHVQNQPCTPRAGGGSLLATCTARSSSMSRLEDAAPHPSRVAQVTPRAQPPPDRSKSAGSLGGRSGRAPGVPSRPAWVSALGGSTAGSRRIGRTSPR